LRERLGGRRCARIDKSRQDIQPTEAVCQDMVQHDHHRSCAVREIRDQNDRPQRRLPRQPIHDHREGDIA
jgi:hypothetical protein